MLKERSKGYSWDSLNRQPPAEHMLINLDYTEEGYAVKKAAGYFFFCIFSS